MTHHFQQLPHTLLLAQKMLHDAMLAPLSLALAEMLTHVLV